ncbi:hypothetical protein [Paenibacillus graminis]|uniref:hypothetical protein n=1 Tax=Paenibacillus graminis TaxID=189425 RepID=UPI002DB9E502|nr:hypothetical protein [Paenibacillus graminis]MEC0172365.1 hypothetical protein [Paenibacillus graminis]
MKNVSAIMDFAETFLRCLDKGRMNAWANSSSVAMRSPCLTQLAGHADQIMLWRC